MHLYNNARVEEKKKKVLVTPSLLSSILQIKFWNTKPYRSRARASGVRSRVFDIYDVTEER